MTRVLIKNRKVCVAGLQGPGIALLQALDKGGAILTGAEVLDADQQAKVYAQFPRDRAAWVFDASDGSRFLGQDLIVTTVGHLSFKAAIQQARDQGIPVMGELDFVSQYFRGTVVAITGTNGKSTSAAMLRQILEEAGVPTMIVEGGRENPLAHALGKPLEVVICEVNSTRLKESERFHPHIALLTNLSQAHAERHPNLKDYYLTKAKVYLAQEASDYLVYNDMSESIHFLLEEKAPKSKRIGFSFGKEMDEGIYRKSGNLHWRYSGVESVFSLEGFALRGAQNVENLMGAIAVAKLLKIDDSAVLAAIPKLRPLPTRLQSLGKIQGVEYYNDARSANPAATAWSLHALKKQVVLIAGGEFIKGLAYEQLSGQLKAHAKMLILFGPSRKRFFEILGGQVETFLVESLEEAVQLAYRKAEKGDFVLFSPGTPASLGEHVTIGIRGEDFNRLVVALKNQELDRNRPNPDMSRI